MQFSQSILFLHTLPYSLHNFQHEFCKLNGAFNMTLRSKIMLAFFFFVNCCFVYKKTFYFPHSPFFSEDTFRQSPFTSNSKDLLPNETALHGRTSAPGQIPFFSFISSSQYSFFCCYCYYFLTVNNNTWPVLLKCSFLCQKVTVFPSQ